MMQLAVCMAYYDNPSMLQRQLQNLGTFTRRGGVEYSICDDGSPRYPIAISDAVRGTMNLSVERIDVDVRWNQDAARNLAVANSTAPWLLLTDMDHFIPQSTLYDLLLLEHQNALIEQRVYKCTRFTVTDDTLENATPYKVHPNSWLMHRSMWEKIGGYDERLAGYYGTDADFRNSVLRHAGQPHELREFVLYRVPREIIADASTTTYGRKELRDKNLGQIIRSRNIHQPMWRPARFTFPHHTVFKCSL